MAHRKPEDLCLQFLSGIHAVDQEMNVLVQLTCPVLEINRWLVCACFPDASNDDVFYTQGFDDLLRSCHKRINLHLKKQH